VASPFGWVLILDEVVSTAGAHTSRRENEMGVENKAKAAADKVAGSAKEATGKATDNDELIAEGKTDQAKGHARDAAEDVKDAFRQ
jgi:uncharacterized protein YjbJ (UPF0337 family)